MLLLLWEATTSQAPTLCLWEGKNLTYGSSQAKPAFLINPLSYLQKGLGKK